MKSPDHEGFTAQQFTNLTNKAIQSIQACVDIRKDKECSEGITEMYASLYDALTETAGDFFAIAYIDCKAQGMTRDEIERVLKPAMLCLGFTSVQEYIDELGDEETLTEWSKY